jgi:predicted methyltransferase
MLRFAIALVALSFAACAASPTAKPGAARPLDAAAITVLLAAPERSAADRARDAREQPAVVLPALGIAPGMRVVDVFAGAGYYAELVARAVGPGGTVYLHNNAAYLGFTSKELEARLAALKLPQLVRYDREVEAIDLAPGSLDAALLVMAYHDVYWTEKDWTVTRDPLLAMLQRVLRPGGRVLVVDHSAVDGSGTSAVQELHRIDGAVVREDFARAGFRLIASNDALRNPADDRGASAFAEAIRGRTDRFVLVFEAGGDTAR